MKEETPDIEEQIEVDTTDDYDYEMYEDLKLTLKRGDKKDAR